MLLLDTSCIRAYNKWMIHSTVTPPSSSCMCINSHSWSAKQQLHRQQSVAETSCHLTSSSGHRLDLTTETCVIGCLIPFHLTGTAVHCAGWKRSSKDHCCCERLKPGWRIVGSSTMEKMTTWADFQFSFHWLLMSNHTRFCCRGFSFLDGRQIPDSLVISEWIGQFSRAIFFSMSYL